MGICLKEHLFPANIKKIPPLNTLSIFNYITVICTGVLTYFPYQIVTFLRQSPSLIYICICRCVLGIFSVYPLYIQEVLRNSLCINVVRNLPIPELFIY